MATQSPQNLHVTQPLSPQEQAVPTWNIFLFGDIFILPLINCELQLDLPWTKDCVLIEHHIKVAGANFLINSTKLYVPVITFSINDNIKFLESIKPGFKRTISCNKYRPEITTQAKRNKLDYLIHPTFRNINRLFVLSFKNVNGDCKRDFLISITCH